MHASQQMQRSTGWPPSCTTAVHLAPSSSSQHKARFAVSAQLPAHFTGSHEQETGSSPTGQQETHLHVGVVGIRRVKGISPLPKALQELLPCGAVLLQHHAAMWWAIQACRIGSLQGARSTDCQGAGSPPGSTVAHCHVASLQEV